MLKLRSFPLTNLIILESLTWRSWSSTGTSTASSFAVASLFLGLLWGFSPVECPTTILVIAGSSCDLGEVFSPKLLFTALTGSSLDLGDSQAALHCTVHSERWRSSYHPSLALLLQVYTRNICPNCRVLVLLAGEFICEVLSLSGFMVDQNINDVWGE